LEYCNYKRYYERSITTDGTVHNKRPDIVLFDKIVIKAYSMHLAIPNIHTLYIIITEKLQKYTDLKDELTKTWQRSAVDLVSILLSTTGVISNCMRI
jgi:hypothetical protein